MAKLEMLDFIDVLNKHIDFYEQTVKQNPNIELDKTQCKALLVTLEVIIACPEPLRDDEKAEVSEIKTRIGELLFPMFGTHKSMVDEKYKLYNRMIQEGRKLSQRDQAAYDMIDRYVKSLGV